MRKAGFWFVVGLLALTGCPNTGTSPSVKASTKPRATASPAAQATASPSPSASPITKAGASPSASPTASPSPSSGGSSPSPSSTATTGASASPSPSPTASASPSPSPSPTGTPGLAASVDIKDFLFSPASVTIKVGGTVTFTNKGAAAHTVSPVSGLTFDDPGAVQPGKTRTVTFTTAGTANYQCNFHTSMKGTITVVP